MFTGIIQEVGTIKAIETVNDLQKITIEAPLLANDQKIGSSVSFDGACLTVISKTPTTFTVEAIDETLHKTIIGHYRVGTKVNLEPALKMGESLDGHLVTGHVDARGKIVESELSAKDGETLILRVDVPLEVVKYVAMKGSVTINGVSLTVSKLHPDGFEVSLIPHTQKVTNLGLLKKDDEVNIEIDLIARYLERLLDRKDKEITYQFLQQRGFI